MRARAVFSEIKNNRLHADPRGVGNQVIPFAVEQESCASNSPVIWRTITPHRTKFDSVVRSANGAICKVTVLIYYYPKIMDIAFGLRSPILYIHVFKWQLETE